MRFKKIATALHASHPKNLSVNPMQVNVAESQAILFGPVSYVFLPKAIGKLNQLAYIAYWSKF
jgi:hypothetical protein